MVKPLDNLTIKGFKSIRELDGFALRNLNIFVGANGAGKSNLIAFFRLLQASVEDQLTDYIRDSGGISDLLYNGRKTTREMLFSIHFGVEKYGFTIKPGAGEHFSLADETTANSEAVLQAIKSWKLYHFHDTSPTAAMRHAEIIEDNRVLRYDAANIGSFLLRLRDENRFSYNDIRNACRAVAPFFDDFLLEPQIFGPKTKVALSWRAKGSDYPMQPYHLSDGTIRFICLATALLQPTPPSTIIIDEPELGLHPEAISILNELIEDAARRTQIVIATQSPLLLNHFAIEDIVVVKRSDGQSTFERLRQEDYPAWLESYSIGELWVKNVIAGGVAYE